MKKIYLLFFLFTVLSAGKLSAQTDEVYAVGPDAGGNQYGGAFAADHIKLNLAAVAAFLNGNPVLPPGKTRFVFELQSDYTENITAKISFTSTVNAVIRPKLGHTGVTLSATPPDGVPVFEFNGADNITFDGRQGGIGSAVWTIENVNPGDQWGVFNFRAGANSNTLSYLTIKSGGTAGVVIEDNQANSNEIIEYCKFRKATGLAYGFGVFATATGANTHSNIIIRNNDMADFIGTGVYVAGNAAISGWEIYSNSFYRTAPSSTSFSAVNIGIGSNHKIHHNNIGGSDVNMGGTDMQITCENIGASFAGIVVNVGSSTSNTEIYENQIANITANNNNSTSPAFYGIWIKGGSTYTHDNRIGMTNAINLVTYGDTYGILVEGNDGNVLYGNDVQSISAGRIVNCKLGGIRVNAAGATRVINNRIGGFNSNTRVVSSVANTYTNPVDACTGIIFDGAGTGDIFYNSINVLTNVSPAVRAPVCAISVNNGSKVDVYENNIKHEAGFFGGTNNGLTNTFAGYNYGVYHSGGVLNMHDNWMILGTGNIENIVGIGEASTVPNCNYVYNTIYLNGNTTGQPADNTSAYGFFRLSNATSTIFTLANNLFYNNRLTQGAKVYGLGIGDVTGWLGFVSSHHNVYVANGNKPFSYNNAEHTLSEFMTDMGELYSYAYMINDVPADNLFAAADRLVTCNLSIKANDPSLWVLHGKGYPLLTYANDYKGQARSVVVPNGASDIGAEQITPAGAGATPPDATITGLHAVDNVEFITVGNLPVAEIKWSSTGAGTVLPTISAKYFSGVQPTPLPNPQPGKTPQLLNGYWQITETTAGTNYGYDLKLYVDPAMESGLDITDPNISVYKKPAAGGWQTRATLYNSADNSLSITGQTSFSMFTAADATTVLPVTLEYFSAAKNNDDVVVKWKSTIELDHKMYEAERSYDGKNFSTFKTVTPNAQKEYSVTDENILNKFAGKIYYRLKMVSTSNVSTYSAVAVIDNTNTKTQAIKMISENPFADHIDLQFNNERSNRTNIMLYDAAGKLVGSRTALLPVGNSSVRLDNLNKLSAATYTLKVSTQTGGMSLQVMKK